LRQARWGGHKPKAISGEHQLWVLQRTKSGTSRYAASLAELADRGLKVDYRSVWEVCVRRKAELKKTVAAGERDRPDVAPRRAQWIGYQNRVEPDRLVFINETQVRTDMPPLRGGTLRGP
jgi:hypothetical protein